MNRRQRLIEEIVHLTMRTLKEGQQEIDSILDKIKVGGVASLRPNEKKYLDHYSHTGEFDESLMKSEYDEAMEEILGREEVQEFIEIDPENVEFLTTEELEAYQVLYGDILIELSLVIEKYRPTKHTLRFKDLAAVVGSPYSEIITRLQEVGEKCLEVLINRGDD